jgi:enoyl-CoA hydratase
LTGQPVKAEEALQIGLINEVNSDPVGKAKELLTSILSNAPLAVTNAIKAVYHADGGQGFQIESDSFGYLCSTDDAREGLSAFLEKRDAEFKGK